MYKHGTIATIGNDQVQSTVLTSTVVLYIGTAPVHLVKNYLEKDSINKPIKIESLNGAKEKVGYSDDWAKYTLCEAFKAHFNNTIGNVGPIYIINVLDPVAHRKTEQVTKQLQFVNGKTEFESETIIIDTFLLTGKVLDVDYTAYYDFTKKKVIVESLNEEEPLAGALESSYYEVDLALVTKDTIIGGNTNGQLSGLQSIKLLYQDYNAILNVLAAPGWSHDYDVYSAMVSASQKINGHWDAFVNADLPMVNPDDGTAIDTKEKAIAWKKANGYNSGFSKVCWPKFKNVDDVYYGSTIVTVEMQRQDNLNNGIPFETPSNKQCMVTKQYFGDNSKNSGYDQQEANNLNENGITTAVFWGGQWVVWGPHTAAYQYGSDVDAKYIFDTNIRMLMHIGNGFQARNGTKIDSSLNLSEQQSILVSEQEELDRLVSIGALIGGPIIEFIQLENPTSELVNGNFVWHAQATPTPLAKSLALILAYTDAGFQAYYGGEE